MSEAVLAEFPILKPVDVTVAARKARVLAALANIERARRTRFGKAVTEACRGITAVGGTPLVRYQVGDSDTRPTVEVVVTWMESVRDRTATNSTAPKSTGRETKRGVQIEQTMALRRLGELLDSFSLDGWPGVGATVTLQVFASPGMVLSEEDVAHWSEFLSENQVEEVVRHAEQRRRLLVSELQSSLQQEKLLTGVGGEASETGLVTMLSLVASKTDNGVAILGSNTRIVWVNEAFRTHTGFQQEHCQGRKLDELISHSDADSMSVAHLERTLASTSSGYVELLIGRRDGTSCWAGITLTPVFEADDTVGRWIVLMRDVTKQKQHQEALAAARDAAEQASRSKSEFLANMSHEIRTPMNAVIGMTELALGTELTSEQQEYLSTVRMSAEALLELLNDILDLSKIEAGKVELDEVDFDLADVLRDALKSLAVKAHGKSLELATHLPMDLPHHLHGDPLRLRQVLINLVGNAIKFTEQGEVVIEFSADGPLTNPPSCAEADDGAELPTCLHFTVRDTGVGIHPERLGRIFEAFIQADTSTTRQFGGTGLGLTITAELLRLMGGQVRVESEVGVGSAFHVSIPLQLAIDVPQQVGKRVEFSREQLKDRTVLVVDDNATNCRILEEMLGNWGLRPRITDGATAALKELEAAAYYGRPFDLLIVDSMMPERDGFDLLTEIRNRNDLNVNTVMMLSSADRADSSRRCRELGVATYLVKPVSQASLLEAVVGLLDENESPFRLDRRGTDQQLTPHSTDHSKGTSHSKGQRTHVPLHILIADDHPSNRALAEKILEKRGHRSTHAATGKEVLAKLDSEKFDLILMDVQMPELDGFQTTAAIRNRKETAGMHMPIVALTAHAMKGDREKCLAAGMDAYLSKPLRARELISLVEKLCEPVARARIGTAAARSDAEFQRAPGVSYESMDSQTRSTSIDFSGALDRMDGDQDLLVEQMSFFLTDAPLLLSEVSLAIDSASGRQLQSAAHRLKGLVASYDQVAAAESCRQLEFAGRDSVLDGAQEILARLVPQIDRLSDAIRHHVATQGQQ